MAVYCWGNAENGELGIGGQDEIVSNSFPGRAYLINDFRF